MFRFFLDMDMETPTFDASTFAKNKERLLAADVARQFFEGVVRQAKDARLMSGEHFTVDGTLIEAWASANPTVNFHGEKRSNATHESTTDPESKLARKGPAQAAKLSYATHVLMENRNGLCVDVTVNQASGTAEWDGALEMLDRQLANGSEPSTLGADAGYDVQRFVTAVRERGITPRADEGPSSRFARRRADDKAYRLRGQPTRPKEGRGDIRLDENGRRIPEDQIPRQSADGAVGLPDGCRVQPGPNVEPASRVARPGPQSYKSKPLIDGRAARGPEPERREPTISAAC